MTTPNATRLFGEAFISRPSPSGTDEAPFDGGPGVTGDVTRRPQIIKVEGFTVHVEGRGCSILVERNGKEVLVLEESKKRLAT